MILIRSVLYFVAMVISVVVFGLLIAIFGRFVRGDFSDVVATNWGKFNLWLQRVICGLRYEIRGLENLPETDPVIVMSKHQSTWETISLRGIFRPQQSWVLKKELMNLPIFGWALGFTKSIPIDRTAGRRAIIQVAKQGIARLNENRYVIIFPEGTRTDPGQRRKYGLGGGVLAERSGVPVIPIAHNAGVFWRRRGVKKYPGTIQVIIGSPIPSSGKKATQIMSEVEDWIEARQQELPETANSM